jgi:hypothetical protein
MGEVTQLENHLLQVSLRKFAQLTKKLCANTQLKKTKAIHFINKIEPRLFLCNFIAKKSNHHSKAFVS